MLVFNETLDDYCIAIIKDNNNNQRVISGDAGSILYDWWHECDYVANNDAPVLFASCFGVEVRCHTFEEYMKMIDRIARSCDGVEMGE